MLMNVFRVLVKEIHRNLLLKNDVFNFLAVKRRLFSA